MARSAKPIRPDTPLRLSRGDELRRAAETAAAIPNPELAAKLREAAVLCDELDAVLRHWAAPGTR